MAEASVSLQFTEEHAQLRDVVQKFLAENSDEAAVRVLMASESGYDEAVWARMAEELGLQGLVVPEEFGGSGLGAVELAIVLEEMGGALYCGPFFSTAVLAATALLESGDRAAQEELLPRIASGQLLVSLASDEALARGDAAAPGAATARASGGTHSIRGVKAPVLDGHIADCVLVTARTERGPSLFRVEREAAGFESKALSPLDPTRKLARLQFSDTPATLVGEEGAADAILERTLDRAVAGLAAEQLGGAQRCLDMALSYARERIQFGRPIGSFQAIKHRCADLLLEVEAARSAATYAAFCAAEAPDQLPTAASMAKATCSEAYFRAAADNIQIHGGIGFTWEHPCHLYFKRAKSSELLLGDPIHHRARVAELVGI